MADNQAESAHPRSHREQRELIDSTVSVKRDDMAVDCIVSDVRMSFGYTELLVSPVAGSGECWVRDWSRKIGGGV